MTLEKEFFLQVLSDHLLQRTTDPVELLDWAVIMRLSNNHQLDGIVFYQCKNFMPEAIKASYEKLFATTVYYYSNRKAVLWEIKKAFQKNLILYSMLKGADVAQFYPVPALRTMGDIDFIVPPEKMKQAIDCVRQLGFQGSEITSVQQWGGKRNGIYIEIHSHLVQEGEYATKKQARFFNELNDYIENNKLDWSFHFLYLLMHLRKHFLNQGVGLRQFMDLAVLIQKDPGLNWEWMEEKLKELDLLKFSHVCYALIDKWFQISPPLINYSLKNEDEEKITNKILKNGVFGFSDFDNKLADSYTALIKEKGPMWYRRLKILFRKTFLNYNIIKGIPEYAFVDGRKWALPIAWAKRFVIILKRDNQKDTKEVISSSFVSRKELVDREKLLQLMGLI